MIRFSSRLQQKRERVLGTWERILPGALVLDEPFQLRIVLLGEEAKELLIVAKSTDSTKNLIRRIERIRDIPQGITRIAFRKRVWNSRSQTVWLHDDELLCNCFIGPRTRLYAEFVKSADAGYEYYRRGNYAEAAAHLSATLADPDDYPFYAAEYADICLRNLDGVVRPREEAAKWFLIASRSCDETVRSYLCSLSDEFAKKMHDVEQKETEERRLIGRHRYERRLALVEDLVAEWSKKRVFY